MTPLDAFRELLDVLDTYSEVAVAFRAARVRRRGLRGRRQIRNGGAA